MRSWPHDTEISPSSSLTGLILYPLNRHDLNSRLRYAFDNYMSRGTIALILGLFVLSLLFIVVVSIVVLVSGTLRENPQTQAMDLPELVWRSLLRTLDPGTMGGDVGSVPFVLAMLTVTLGGIFVVAALIGIISTGLQGKLDELRKGHSRVLESDHTVILGWSPQIFAIISEIVLANANKRGQRIVVLADHDKVEMEDEIRLRIPNPMTTRIVCRSGSPMMLVNIAIANVQSSRSIIVLAPPTDDPDTEVIKVLLAITNDPDRRPEPYQIVAEIHEPKNVDVARLASRGEAQIILGGQLIGRIAAQVCRQPGLSVVYMDLLDFAGDEFYFVAVPELVGSTFGEALLNFRDASLVGIAPPNATAQLNPPVATRIGEADRLIFIARDDDAVERAEMPEGSLAADKIVTEPHEEQRADATLMLGWNSRTPGVIYALDRYAAEGSRLTVLADTEGVAEAIDALRGRLETLTINHRSGDTTDRETLDAVTAEGYDHVMVISYADMLDEQRADARTLVTLLHLRDIEAKRGESYTIVSEVLDVRNRALAQVTRADDFIVSGKLVSLAMSQLAENPGLQEVFEDLFDEHGSEIYLKPARDYVVLGEAVDFYTVVDSARRREEVAFGYRLFEQADDPDRNYGVVINPDKAALVTFGASDRVIVLAED